MKVLAMLCRATQDRQIMVETSDKTWSTGEGNGKHFSILSLRTPWIAWKGKKITTLKDELPRLVGAQYATGEDGEITPEKMKRWSQSKNNIQLWMSLVTEVKSNTVKSNIA